MKSYVRLGLINLVVALLLLAVGCIVVEGVHSLLHLKNPKPGPVQRACARCFGWGTRARASDGKKDDADSEEIAAAPSEEMVKALADSDVLVDEASLRKFLPEMRKLNMMMGNTFFNELVTPEARITYEDPKLGLWMKPNLSVGCAFVRTVLYGAHSENDPLTITIPSASRPRVSRELNEWLARYSAAPVSLHTDGMGFRKTVPESAATNIVLVLGDSVAFGVMISDEQTLASRLQQRDPSHRYITDAVPGGSGADNLRRLEDRIARWGSAIKGVVYVHCENDLSKQPADYIIPKLMQTLNSGNIPWKVFVSQRYYYTSMPEIRQNVKTPKRLHKHALLMQEVRKAPFDFVLDCGDLVRDYQREKGSLFAGYALHVDHCHYSDEGTRLIVAHLPLPGQRQPPPEPAPRQ